MGLTKKELNLIAKNIGVKNPSKMKKEELLELINKNNKVTTLKENKHLVKYIYHSADLHIRPLERHDEYKHVFDNLIIILKEKAAQNPLFKEENVFILCGDIFHSRDKLLSETILLFNEFLVSLTSIIPVIFILGNHDTFIHANRMDTVSGITDIKGFPDFYFLKESGIYKYSNIVFGLSSVLDNIFIKAEELTVFPDCIKIALYHGQVKGAKINDLYDVPDNPDILTINDFKGYDLCLLGDIHKRQYLSPTIAYPGSLIQQNHGEDLDKGFLLWDISKKESEFISIPNDYSFISISSSDYKAKNYTKYSRIRLYLTQEELSNTELEETIIQFLNSQTTVISLTKEIYKPKKTIKPQTALTYEVFPSKERIIKDFFYDYLQSCYQVSLSDEIIEKIKQKHLEMTEIISKNNNEEKQYINWSINHLTFKNVFSYGKDILNTVFFEKDKIIGILGTNAIGKTSIMNTLIYALFGNNYKGSNTSSRNILNKNSSQFFIELEIQRGKDTVKIQKIGKNKARKGSIKGINEDVKLFINNKEITDTNKSVTLEKWYELLGIQNKESFLLTNLLSYTSINCSLLSMTSTEIGNTLNTLFDTSYLRDIYALILKEYKQNNTELDVYKKTISNLVIKDNVVLHKKLENILQEIENYEVQKQELSEEIKGISPYQKDDYSDKTVQFKKEFLEKELFKNIEKLTYFQATTGNIKSKKEYTIDTILCFQNKLKETGVPLKNPLNYLQAFIKDTRKEIKYVKEQQKSNNFTEKFDVNLLIEDLEQYKDKVLPKDLFEDTVEYLKDTLTPSYITFSYQSMIYEEIVKIKETNKLIEEKIQEIEGLIDTYNDIQNFISYELYQKKQCEKYFENYEIYLRNKGKESLYTKFNIVEKELLLLFKKQGSIENEISSNKGVEDKIKQLNTKMNIILSKNEYLYHYKEIIRVLPKLIITDIIKNIEYEANIILYKFTGLQVNLNTIEEEDSKWEITFSKDKIQYIGADNLSGYEKFIANIAIKLALDKFKFQGKAKIFCIDEVFDSVSEENIEHIPSIFEILKENYSTVLMISHNTSLKHSIDKLIKIQNSNGNSVLF